MSYDYDLIAVLRQIEFDGSPKEEKIEAHENVDTAKCKMFVKGEEPLVGTLHAVILISLPDNQRNRSGKS